MLPFGSHQAPLYRGSRQPAKGVSSHGWDDTVKLLLVLGAKVDSTTSDGVTPVFGSCQAGNLEIAALLLEADASYVITDGGA